MRACTRVGDPGGCAPGRSLRVSQEVSRGPRGRGHRERGGRPGRVARTRARARGSLGESEGGVCMGTRSEVARMARAVVWGCSRRGDPAACLLRAAVQLGVADAGASRKKATQA